MAIINITVTDSEKEWLQYMADFYGISLSDLLKEYSMDQLEYDTQVAEIAHKKYLEDDQTVSMKKVLNEFH